jgi:hypothetical protein
MIYTLIVGYIIITFLSLWGNRGIRIEVLHLTIFNYIILYYTYSTISFVNYFKLQLYIVIII